jgi:hypothetical protein
VTYIPNGTGLVTYEGFSVPDGSGYVVRKSHYGCQTLWPGYFIDAFNYAVDQGNVSSTDQNWGPDLFSYSTDSNPKTDGTGVFFNIGNFPSVIRVNCPSVPALTDHYSEVTLTARGTTTTPAGVAIPSYGGGPAVQLQRTGGGVLNLYYVNCLQAFRSPGSADFTHVFQLNLRGIIGATDYPVATFNVLTGGTGFNNAGWFSGPTRIRLETRQSGGGVNALKVYQDGSLLFSITDNGIAYGGTFGMRFPSGANLSLFKGGAL